VFEFVPCFSKEAKMVNPDERQDNRQQGVSVGAGLGIGFIWLCCFVFLYLIATLLFPPTSKDVAVNCTTTEAYLVGFGFIALTCVIFSVLATNSILQVDKSRDE
jgi:ABC-type antimicrobial peptide transport system permease subunit